MQKPTRMPNINLNTKDDQLKIQHGYDKKYQDNNLISDFNHMTNGYMNSTNNYTLQEQNQSQTTEGDPDIVFQLTKRMSDINDSYKIQKVNNRYKTLINFGKNNGIRRSNLLRFKEKNKKGLTNSVTKNNFEIHTDRSSYRGTNKSDTYRQNAFGKER